MRLSTKGRYALEAIVFLAFHEDEIVSIKTISEESGISQKYLEQIFRDLKNSSLIISQKGKYGGYQLAKNIDEMCVGEIFRAVEGSLAPVKCVEYKNCRRYDECKTKCLWSEISEEINDVVDNISVENLVNNYKNEIGDDKTNENIN